jgi:hypothetical protein
MAMERPTENTDRYLDALSQGVSDMKTVLQDAYRELSTAEYAFVTANITYDVNKVMNGARSRKARM